jgi:DNA ligase-1
VSKQWSTLYVKTSGGSINYWKIWTHKAVVLTEWGQVGTDKPQFEEYTAVGKNIGRSNETSPEDQAESEAQSKYDKQIRLKYVTSIDAAESNLNIKPMLAYPLDAKREKKLKFPVSVQPKYNGVRCMAYRLVGGDIRLMSRGGKDYTLPHIQNELKGKLEHGFCLDGELYIHGMSLQTIRHHIETYTEESLQVKLVCYDCTNLPPSDQKWIDRLGELEDFFAAGQFEHIEFSLTRPMDSVARIKSFHDMCVEDGYEGAIIRSYVGVYKLAARSSDLLKYKQFQDAEFKAIGYSTGKDGVIKYICVQEDGKQFEVRPRGNEVERARLLKNADKDLGKMLTVRFQERSDDNIPLICVGIGFRPPEDMD